MDHDPPKPVALVFQLPASPLPHAACFAIRDEQNVDKRHVSMLPDVEMDHVHDAMMAALDGHTDAPEVYSECFTDAELGQLETMQFTLAYFPLVDLDTLAHALERDGFMVARQDAGAASALTRHLALTSIAAVRVRLPFHAAQVPSLVQAGLVASPPDVERFVAAVEAASQTWTPAMRDVFVAVGARGLVASFGSGPKSGPAPLARSAGVRAHLEAWAAWLATSLADVGTTALAWNERFVVRALVTGAVDETTKDGVTPLWQAVHFGRHELAGRLLRAGARMDGHDADRIERAAGEMRVVSHWHGKPPEPGHPAPTGASSLLHAAVSSSGTIDVVRLLLEHGAAVDGRDRYGDTPLHLAAASASPAVVALLLDRGADPNALDRWGRAPVDFADVDTLPRLLARGADPNGGPGTAWRESDLWSVVTNAAYAGNLPVLELLIAAGADPTRHSDALRLAREQNQRECARLLEQHGFAGAARD